MPTKDQLRSIEWAGKDRDGYSCCPACRASVSASRHADWCWLDRALATPDTMPQVEVGDVVELAWPDGGKSLRMVQHVGMAERFNGEHSLEVSAIYRTPLWQRKET